MEERSTLDCLDRWEGWGTLDSTKEQYMNTGLPLRQGGERSTLAATWFPTTTSLQAPAQASEQSSPAHSEPLCSNESGVARIREKTQPWDTEAEGSRWVFSSHFWHFLKRCPETGRISGSSHCTTPQYPLPHKHRETTQAPPPLWSEVETGDSDQL